MDWLPHLALIRTMDVTLLHGGGKTVERAPIDLGNREAETQPHARPLVLMLTDVEAALTIDKPGCPSQFSAQ